MLLFLGQSKVFALLGAVTKVQAQSCPGELGRVEAAIEKVLFLLPFGAVMVNHTFGINPIFALLERYNFVLESHMAAVGAWFSVLEIIHISENMQNSLAIRIIIVVKGWVLYIEFKSQ